MSWAERSTGSSPTITNSAAPTCWSPRRCGTGSRRLTPVSVTDDVSVARALAAEQFAMYAYLPYRVMLGREGFPPPRTPH